MKNLPRLKLILPLVLVFAAVFASLPRTSKFPYDYRRGQQWNYETLFAEFDFPVYKTADQMREERETAAVEVVPYYKYSEEIANKNISAAEALDLGSLRGAVASEIRAIYNKGVIADTDERDKAGVPASDVIYVQRDKRAYKVPSTEVYLKTDAKAKLLADLGGAADVNLDSLFKVSGVYDIIVPNVLFDAQTTELVNEDADRAVSPTSGYVSAGQVIVSKGEIVTQEIEQMLDSYKAEFEANVGYIGPPALMLLGNFIIAAALTLMLYLAILFSCPAVFADSRYPYILVVYLAAALSALLLGRAGASVLYFAPFTLAAIMLQAFMEPREIAPVYVVSMMPLLFASSRGPVMFVMYVLAGLVMILIFRCFQRGWKQFLAAMITFAILACVYLGFRAADVVSGSVWGVLMALFAGSLLTVAGYPLVFLFERIFNLVSNSRLIELCDTSNPLIRTLEQKAPGTFQHSLQVMNMADAVARAIGINPDLIRAGALYHDIGKTCNPLCFVENESLLNQDEEHKYHSGLTPLQSAHDIKRHVDDGIEIAQKHHMPQLIVDFIATHHGTTLVRFFYNKFLKEGGDPALAPEFRYNGRKPVTKAQIVLMLCDSVEAASRTVRENTPKAYSDFVEGIVAGKMDEGQFDNADITISELNTVKETLKQYLAQLNHERIAYPKNKSNKK